MRSDRIQRRIETLLDEADQAISESRWDTVKDRAQNVLALDPDNADARTFLDAAERALRGLPPSGRGAGESPTLSGSQVLGNGPHPDPLPKGAGTDSPTS